MIPVILLAGLHLFIAYRARMMLPTLVKQMSDGNYTLTAKKLRFNYFNPSIRLTGISFHPIVDGLDQTFQVTVDTLVLEIEKILPLILNRQVNVEDILIVSPDIEIKRHRKGEAVLLGKDDLNTAIGQLQGNTMTFLNELKVKRCRIKNASFRYFPFPENQRKYSIRHIDLSVANFNLPKPENDTSNFSVEGDINLNIQDPEIEIPDSFKRVQLDYFNWSNKKHDVSVGKFSISQRSLPPRVDSFLIQLDTIAIRKINWKTWIDSGIIKMDTIMAKNGSMYFESSPKEERKTNKKDSVDFKKLKVWDAIGNLELDFFSAQYINVGIINKNPGEERNNSLIGDSLAIHSLSIKPENENPIKVNSLALSVRSFLDRGTNTNFQSSFSRLSLRGDTMLLSNYVLQSTKNSKFGLGNSLSIPSLSIKGISLQDLMDKKANVREIRMDNPELNILSGGSQKVTGGKLLLNSNMFKEIRPYVDVDRVVLNNAKVTIRDRADKNKVMGTEKFSAVILSRSALAAKDAEGIMSSITNVNMDHLFFITPVTKLELFGGFINYRGKTLHFRHLVGSLDNKKIQAKLNDVTLQGSIDMRPFNKDQTWHLTNVNVGSGSMDINMSPEKDKAEDRGDRLLGVIDTMSLTNIAVKFRRDLMAGDALIKNFYATGQKSFTSGYKWDKFDGVLEKLKVTNEKFSVESDEVHTSSSGRSTARNAKILLKTETIDLAASAPAMVVGSEFHSFEQANTTIDYLRLDRAIIRLNINPDSTQKRTEEKVSGSFKLTSFSLTEPDIVISRGADLEKVSFISTGKEISGSGLSISGESGERSLSLDELSSSLDKVIVKSDSAEIFSANTVGFNVGDIEQKGKEPLHMRMDKFDLGAVRLDRYKDGDTILLRTGGITLNNIPRLVFQKDSILNTAFKLPAALILPSSFFYRTSEKNIGIYNFSADTKAGYLMWDSLEITNRISRDSFFRIQAFEKDYITASTGRLRADDLRPVIFGSDTTVYMRKLTIDPLHLMVERDKRMPDDTVTYRPLLVRMLKRIIPFPLKIDSVQLIGSEIRHNVLKEKTGNEGSIFFTDIRGYIFNLRTFDYREHDSIRIALESKFMGKGNLVFAFRQDYTDTLQGFLMGGRMAAGMDMTELNRLITPLFGVKINKGKLKSLQLRVKGNDRLAYGSMDMYYDGLKLSVLDDDNHRKKFYSFLVNMIVRTKNSKTGIVYAERLREKSVFNFWARISLNGLLTNLGVKKNGAQVRRFYRSLKKHQLPEDIF